MDSDKKHLLLGFAIGSLSMLAANVIAKKFFPEKVQVLEEFIEDDNIDEDSIKRILVCGSGMMVPGLVSFLVRNKRNLITIASNILEDAEAIVRQYPARCSATLLDVNDHKDTTDLVKAHDIVISYVPPFLHPKIFKACIDAERNLVTASYISPEMLSFDEEAKSKGLLFLNECGLDPGIDIMSTMKVKDEVERAGGKIIKYESWCGGLPSAEDADNPLSYKFSWDPKAVFNTSKNSARFMKDGEVVDIEAHHLLNKGTENKPYLKSLSLEGYPNRDSLTFKEAFGFKDAKTFVRGTLRYGGFGVIMEALHQIGFTDSHTQLDHSKIKTVRDLAESLAEGNEANTEGLEDLFKKVKIINVEDKVLISKLLQKVSNKEDSWAIVNSWKYFELLNDSYPVTEAQKTPLDVLSAISLKKMSYQHGERDLVIMKHIFEIETADGKIEELHSTMMASGDKIGSGGLSVMAKTVGYTTGVAVNLILDGKITTTGVWSPKTEDFYGKILPELEKDGIKVTEEYQ